MYVLLAAIIITSAVFGVQSTGEKHFNTPSWVDYAPIFHNPGHPGLPSYEIEKAALVCWISQPTIGLLGDCHIWKEKSGKRLTKVLIAMT